MPDDPDALARLAYLVLLLAGLAWFRARGRGRRGGSLRLAALWALIFGAVALGYGLFEAWEPR